MRGKENGVCKIIDVAKPADMWGQKKDDTPFGLWKSVDMIPGLLGDLGAIPKGVNTSLGNISIRIKPEQLQKRKCRNTSETSWPCCPVTLFGY